MANNSLLAENGVSAEASAIDGFALNESGFCTLCREKTESKCDRCGDFYCSEFCQRRDWQNHRYICFPMPKLVKPGRYSLSKNSIGKGETQPEGLSKTELVKDGQRRSSKNGTAIEDSQLQIASTSSINTNKPSHGSCVLLTGFKSSNRCFILSTNPSIVAEYKKVIDEINDFGKKSTPLHENPKTNSYALAQKRDKWCRVQILGNRKDNNFRVSFVDFGDISRRFVKDLRKITPSLVNLPSFIHMVQLNGVIKFSIEVKLLQSFAKYTNKEYRVEFVEPDEAGGNVKLFQWGGNTSLNTLIQAAMSKHTVNGTDVETVSTTSSLQSTEDVQKSGMQKTSCNGNSNLKDCEIKTMSSENKDAKNEGSAKPSISPRQVKIQKPCLQPPFEIIPLSENERNCKVIITDDSFIDSGYVGCLLEKHVENLTAISKFLREYKVSDQPYKPKLDEYCLAEFENEWYRAKVVEILAEDKFIVVYIDFTNEMELTSELIRRYPMSLTLPCCTTLCAIEGFPEDISDEQKHFLELNCKTFAVLNIDSVRVEEGISYVKSKDLLNKMRNSKLL